MYMYQADYCISLLGDAFITDKVDTQQFLQHIQKFSSHNFKYCKLYHSSNKTKILQMLEKQNCMVLVLLLLCARMILHVVN